MLRSVKRWRTLEGNRRMSGRGKINSGYCYAILLLGQILCALMLVWLVFPIFYFLVTHLGERQDIRIADQILIVFVSMLLHCFTGLDWPGSRSSPRAITSCLRTRSCSPAGSLSSSAELCSRRCSSGTFLNWKSSRRFGRRSPRPCTWSQSCSVCSVSHWSWIGLVERWKNRMSKDDVIS